MIIIDKISEVNTRVHSTNYLEFEKVKKYFSFSIPNKHFNPLVKSGAWNGVINLIYDSGLTYESLTPLIEKFCQEESIECKVNYSNRTHTLTVLEATQFIRSLNLPFIPRKDQIHAFMTAIRDKKRLILSATSSGKSLIIYMVLRYLIRHNPKWKCLLLVPRTSLVEQMFSDFAEYAENDNTVDINEFARTIYNKQNSQSKLDLDKPVLISTWQSMQSKFVPNEKYFANFDVIIGDEAHEYEAKETKRIIDNAHNAEYRIGMTGSLEMKKMHSLMAQAMFGPIEDVIRAKKLIEIGAATPCMIQALLVKHTGTFINSKDYNLELDFVCESEARNNFLINLLLSLKENTLIMFRLTKKHAKPFFKKLKESTDRPVFYIDKDVSVKEREQIRKYAETRHDVIIVATFGTFSTGINIKNLHNLVIGSPLKSYTKLIQSIGRIMRKHETKELAVVFDIGDAIRTRAEENYLLKHYKERLKIYKKEGYEVKNHTIVLQPQNKDTTNGRN